MHINMYVTRGMYVYRCLAGCSSFWQSIDYSYEPVEKKLLRCLQACTFATVYMPRLHLSAIVLLAGLYLRATALPAGLKSTCPGCISALSPVPLRVYLPRLHLRLRKVGHLACHSL